MFWNWFYSYRYFFIPFVTIFILLILYSLFIFSLFSIHYFLVTHYCLFDICFVIYSLFFLCLSIILHIVTIMLVRIITLLNCNSFFSEPTSLFAFTYLRSLYNCLSKSDILLLPHRYNIQNSKSIMITFTRGQEA